MPGARFSSFIRSIGSTACFHPRHRRTRDHRPRGIIRLVNVQVIDLYERVSVGMKVVVQQ
jgi:hypothetical protein